MGVDAQMLLRSKKIRTEREVREHSVALVDAFFGAFIVSRPGQWSWHPNGCHALEIVTEYQQDGDTITPADGEQLIEAHLSGRYYGVGYERGNLPQTLAIASWLKVRMPECEVWYGGDSSGFCAEPLTDARISALWAHFVSHGHRPYFGHRNQFMTDTPKHAPRCSFCAELEMDERMYAQGRTGFECAACGARVLVHADGRREDVSDLPKDENGIGEWERLSPAQLAAQELFRAAQRMEWRSRLKKGDPLLDAEAGRLREHAKSLAKVTAP